MLVCENCGAQNPAGSRFCGVCGATLPVAATQAMPLPAPGPAARPAWLWPAIGAGIAVLLVVLGGALWLASRSAATPVADAAPTVVSEQGASATA
ncbi:MAG: zinc ribbon domain-containing protein, partial [Chloroflexales bacterium]|nr:zinc ribbon domain-containing protein [Chloroflexales bacterium]